MKKRKIEETKKAARAAVAKQVKARPTRSRPVIDTKTYTKTCSKGVACGGEPMLAEGNFFKVKAMADGYASCCKKCWNVRGVERPESVRPAQIAAAKFHHPLATSSHTHTQREEVDIARTTNLPLAGYADVGGSYVPVFAHREPEFLDKEPRR